MYCGHCGAQIADSSKFCPRCGQVMATGGGAIGQSLGQGPVSTVRKRGRLPMAIVAGLTALLVVVGVAGAVYYRYLRGGGQNGTDYVHEKALAAEIAVNGTAYLALPDGTLIEIDDKVRRAVITADREHVVVVLEDGTLYVTDPNQSYKERVAYNAGELQAVRNDGFYYLDDDDLLCRVTYEGCESLLISEDLADYVITRNNKTSSIAYATADGAIYRLTSTESDPERIGSYEDEIDLLCVSDDTSFVVWDDHRNTTHTIMVYDHGSVSMVGEDENDSDYPYYLAELSEDQELCVVMGYGDENLWILHRGEEPVHAILAGEPMNATLAGELMNATFARAFLRSSLYTEDGHIRCSGSDAQYLYVCTDDPDDSDLGNLYAYSMAGDRERILSDIRSASILNGRLVYTDADYNLYTADLDGLTITNETRIAMNVARPDGINMVGEYVYYMKDVDDSYPWTLYCYRFGEEDPCMVAKEVNNYAVSPDGSTAFFYRWEDTDNYTLMMMSWNYGDEDTPKIARNLFIDDAESGLYSGQYDCSIIDPNGFTYTRENGMTEDGDYELSLMYYDGENTRKLVDYVY